MTTSLIVKFSEIDNSLLQKLASMYPSTDVEIITTEVDEKGFPIPTGHIGKGRVTPSDMFNGFIYHLRTFYHHHDVILEIKEIHGIETELPRSKFDVEKAKKLVEFEKSELLPYLEELLGWLKDANWPVAPLVASFLCTVGLPVIPHVRKILRGNDDEWKMWVLSFLVDTEDLVVANALRDEIERIVEKPTRGEVAGIQEIAEEIFKKLI